MTVRIGEGWDVHALVPGRPLVLGGVTIPFHRGLLGHSDADALAHAITDALLGAAGLGDIGRHFPDTDERLRGADSLALLAEAARRVRDAGWEAGNLVRRRRSGAGRSRSTSTRWQSAKDRGSRAATWR